ncbi:glycosyltransferase [Mucilaginibacter sp. KACC 22063]|uniref:glycosyltransferase n=1 Tax=Mucilaginibacter sp. KACC 22063 TaxID=3025666 RepID=UPI002365D577|nr:glycosyltransferase [Mucilaginibacter sp. KACC 22063]WDF55170.1 glycosyltransferase [Mucilaginibacter sp. KACC 22063]
MLTGRSNTTLLSDKKPKVSIITVILNGKQYIEGYFQNVLPYLSNETELIIIDGDSIDGSVDTIVNHSKKIDYWISEPDKGIYDAMNKGIKVARGKWLYFLGVDDRLMEGYNTMLPRLIAENAIYYGNVIRFGQPFKRVYDDYFLTKHNICHQAIFYPRAVFNKYIYDTVYPICADYHLNLKCWKDPDFNFEYHDLMIASFSSNGISTRMRDTRFENDRDRLFKETLRRKDYYHYVYRTQGLLNLIKRVVING